MSLSPLESLRNLWGRAQRETRAKQREFIEGYEFPPGLLGKFSMRWPMLSTQQQTLVFDALRSYFLMCHDACGKMVAMPSRVVDAAWHEFILFTRDYTTSCDNAFGFYLHHTPTEAMKQKAAIPESIELAWRLACRQEGIDPLRPDRLPFIFSLDATLNIQGGHRYDAAEMGHKCRKDFSGGDSSGCGGDASGQSTGNNGARSHGGNCEGSPSGGGDCGDGGAGGGSDGGGSCGGGSCGGGGCGGS